MTLGVQAPAGEKERQACCLSRTASGVWLPWPEQTKTGLDSHFRTVFREQWGQRLAPQECEAAMIQQLPGAGRREVTLHLHCRLSGRHTQTRPVIWRRGLPHLTCTGHSPLHPFLRGSDPTAPRGHAPGQTAQPLSDPPGLKAPGGEQAASGR